ncbi:hypothetical protein [Clostridium neonatale]|uniref:hypothetical protein n=2 Tax=Clostridium neonatale TaxID=137838 RepID=UPI00291BBA19|nr:conserved hypothetical protein [Clostridium neonatale]CAI3651626.1 conserved hypothetical protein [Clostridium neonatale]CAI3677117.1 conserved hypothetical protein [Clostridium neonatale]CAI3677778.1 conserved hypothetical protein [Clostridium neonatale]CAI3698262.1 conserved hypothetical protein [Clostridium neonatale]
MECDRNQLKEILGVSLNALKLIEKRNNLEHRLNKVGYTLIDKYKKKNKYIYVIQKTNKKLKQKISNMYNTNRADKFISYFNIRTIERPMTIQEIAIRLGVSEKTIIKWDNTLQDKRILSKDGFYYFKLDRSNNEIIEISKEEYKTFWKNKSYLKAFADLRKRYMEGEISLTELQLTSGDVAVIVSAIENKYCFKIKKYKVNRNQLYADTRKIIDEYQKGVILKG